MRPSFIKLTIRSVLLCWLLGAIAIFFFSFAQSWTDERAQNDGIFLIRDLLDAEPPERRADVLDGLREHSWVTYSLMSVEEVEQRVGHSVGPGDAIPLHVSTREEWYFMVFKDGQGALAAGPINPSVPNDFFPIGLLIAIIGMPVLAALFGLRIERELSKIHHASQALAVGELDARVDNRDGPSHELAASFNAMAERVERLVRDRDEWVQAVSHELGTPLSRLRFHMELLESAQPEAQREERMHMIARELDALEALVTELLGYVQSDDVKLERRTFDPAQGLRDLAELASLDAQEGDAVAVEVDVPEGVGVFADPRLFLRAIENILRNAMRHAEGAVRLELTQEDDAVRVAVHDDGPGIPEAFREKVKKPFVRVGEHRDHKMGGVGLGLAIVSRILNQHGGKLDIDSAPVLGGARVTTVWPAPPSSPTK